MENTERKEFYTLSNAEAQRTYVGVRRAATWVGFFLPHVQKGFSLLDCGCGVGSITLDLAELVAPGRSSAWTWMRVNWRSRAPMRRNAA